MPTASTLPHMMIATIHEFEMSDGRTARVDLSKLDARAIAKTLGNKALSAGRGKATALDGSIQVTVTVEGQKA